MIRYHRSPDRKRCRLSVGVALFGHIGAVGEIKVFGFWGEYGRKAET
jgi:hypothetical protein